MRARLLAGAAGVTWPGSGTGLLLAGATGKQGMKRCLRGCRESPIPAPSPLVQPRPAQASSGQVKSSRTRPGQGRVLALCLLLSSVELLLCCAVKVVRPSVFFEGPAANNSTLALASPIPPFPRPPLPSQQLQLQPRPSPSPSFTLILRSSPVQSFACPINPRASSHHETNTTTTR